MEYGFNIPDQQSSPGYGFNAPYQPNEPKVDSFPSAQFATQLLTEPMVTNMAMEYGNVLVGSGKQQLEKYVPVTALRYYFAVDTDYVLTKLILLLFPFHHKVCKINNANFCIFSYLVTRQNCFLL